MAKFYLVKQSRQENIIYLVVWGLLFATPLLSLYVRTVNDANLQFDWTEVFLVWRKFAVFLILFLIHNYLLAPLLVYGHKRMTYFSFMVALLVAFAVYQCSNRPDRNHRGRKPLIERTEHRQPPMERVDRHHPPLDEPPMDFEGERPPMLDGAEPIAGEQLPKVDKHRPHDLRRGTARPTMMVGEHDILTIAVLILMFGANLGIKFFFRSREDRKRLEQLEKQNLEQQLEYLRYQINPHFFMNTLNNIHALVDIDPEKAKGTILELSKMMRFVLYEGNKQGVPLARELDFVRHYVTLMRLRYTDKVRITVDLPHEVPDRQIPPLILITFIENAFKHGISYQHESFIEVSVTVGDEMLRFLCRNSKAEKPNEEKGGVGLANVRRRLDLIYDQAYTLDIHDEPDIYTVELNIPL